MSFLSQILIRLTAFTLTFVLSFWLFAAYFLPAPEQIGAVKFAPKIHRVEFIEPLELPKGSGIPHICRLSLRLSEKQQLKLNSQSFGSLNNKLKLKAELAEIIESRKQVGIYREGTNEIDNTVVLHIDPWIKYDDVQKIISDLEEIGAKPILADAQECFLKIGGVCVDDLPTESVSKISR